MDNFLTVAQAAREARVNRSYINRLVSQGVFPGAKQIDPDLYCSPYIIPRQEFDSWSDKRKLKQKRGRRKADHD